MQAWSNCVFTCAHLHKFSPASVHMCKPTAFEELYIPIYTPPATSLHIHIPQSWPPVSARIQTHTLTFGGACLPARLSHILACAHPPHVRFFFAPCRWACMLHAARAEHTTAHRKEPLATWECRCEPISTTCIGVEVAPRLPLARQRAGHGMVRKEDENS